MEATTKAVPGGGELKQEANGVWLLTCGPQTNEHIDAWYAQIEAIFGTANPGNAVILLVDAMLGPITPYFRQRMMTLRAVAHAKGLPTYLAILVEESAKKELDVIANISSLGSKQRLRVFTDREQAISWLTGTLT
jgi:hypothetical protein